MRVLGLEGTAHTFAAAVIDLSDPAEPKSVRILSNVQDMQKPVAGGIHPREAANHHAEVAGPVVRAALEKAETAADAIDLVAFSQGPGLGPCLRTVATAARAFALARDIPLIGVNHCVAHLEIGRALTPAEDPILLYASGGNTQVIAYTRGRYRVIGETLDMGVGNMLDKFGRELGMPFPAGPKIEEIARGGRALVDLPYSIKGMDVAFSGILTTAIARREQHPLADICMSIQETAFGMLCEVTERALAHTDKTEVVLGGGVACNERLRAMASAMAEARGGRSFAPPKSVCVDNGAMIALLGAIEHQSGIRQTLEETRVDQRERTDAIPITWRKEPAPPAGTVRDRYVGAEAVVTHDTFLGREAVRKDRVAKSYRYSELDARLRAARTRAEARALASARRAGVPTPLVYDLDGAALILERIPGRPLRDAGLAGDEERATFEDLGELVAKLHGASLVHGDLTTSNVIVTPRGLALIDFGLSQVSAEPDAHGTDLHVLKEALEATHPSASMAFAWFLAGYIRGGGTKAVERALEEIVRRGRYRGT
ncbi:MAG: bifunctional N(6)-L-threonylcarbamoyladenine synthase/serine/threonine protein kinase [Thermoplasmatota archaeon]